MPCQVFCIGACAGIPFQILFDGGIRLPAHCLSVAQRVRLSCFLLFVGFGKQLQRAVAIGLSNHLVLLLGFKILVAANFPHRWRVSEQQRDAGIATIRPKLWVGIGRQHGVQNFAAVNVSDRGQAKFLSLEHGLQFFYVVAETGKPTSALSRPLERFFPVPSPTWEQSCLRGLCADGQSWMGRSCDTGRNLSASGFVFQDEG